MVTGLRASYQAGDGTFGPTRVCFAMVMASDLVVGLAIGLLMGFALGYGVRSFISYRRHQRGRRRRHTLG
jgi:hypothetical protein